MKQKLPSDLHAFVLKKVLPRVILCVALLVTIALLMVFLGDTIFPSDSDIYRVKGLIVLSAIVIVLWLTGVPFKLIDQTFFGIVEKVDVTTVTDTNVPGRLSKDGFHTDNVVTLRIRTLNEKIKSKTIYRERVKQSEFFDQFKEGDKVFHLYGTDYTINLSNKTNAKCSVCGKDNHIESDCCASCGHTLIKSFPSDQK